MDFILRRMIADVSAWYDLYYLAAPIMLEQTKQLHVSVLQGLYDPERFKSGCDPDAERIALFTETQQAVDKIRRATWI